MTMLGTGMATKIASDFAAAGFVGVSIPIFTAAYGTGSIEGHLIGKTFTTTDTGTITGTGVGTGVGVTGVLPGPISAAIFAALVIVFGGSGPDLITVTDALAAGLTGQLALATLSSSHTPVHIGSGVVDVGSIAAVGGPWGTSIKNLGIGSGLLGSDWPDFATEAATEMASAMALGSGNVVITGPGSNDGAGVGTGTGALS